MASTAATASAIGRGDIEGLGRRKAAGVIGLAARPGRPRARSARVRPEGGRVDERRQNWSALMTSPPLRVCRAWKTALVGSMLPLTEV